MERDAPSPRITHMSWGRLKVGGRGVCKDVSYTVVARETPSGEWKWELNFTIHRGGKSWVHRKFHPRGAAFPTVFSALDDCKRQAGALIEHELRQHP